MGWGRNVAVRGCCEASVGYAEAAMTEAAMTEASGCQPLTDTPARRRILRVYLRLLGGGYGSSRIYYEG